MENYPECLSRMTNDELLQELIDLNQYSPEDMTSDDLNNKMNEECRFEILSRLK